MRAIRRISDNVVLYLVPNHQRVALFPDRARIGSVTVLDVNSTTHEIVADVTQPRYFIGGQMVWDGDWSILDQPQYDAALSGLPKYLDDQEAETKAEVFADQQVRNMLKSTPAEIETYIDTNVTDMASAKEVMKVLAKALSALAKREFRGTE